MTRSSDDTRQGSAGPEVFGELELGPKAEKGGQTCLRIEIQNQYSVASQGIPLRKMYRCCRF